MLNGFGHSQRDTGHWKGAQEWLSTLVIAETESGVLACLLSMLAAVGLPLGLYLEKEGGGKPSDAFRPDRAWRMGAPPRPVPVPPPIFSLQDAGEARLLAPAELLALRRHLRGEELPAGGDWGLLLPLRMGSRLLGVVLAIGGEASGGEPGPTDREGRLPGMLEHLAPLAGQVALALERARLNARLPLLESRMQAVEHAQVGLFQTDAEGRLVWCNTCFQKITTLYPEIGHDFWAYLLTGQEQQRFLAWWQDGLQGREGPSQQFALHLPGGRVRWVEISRTPLFAPGGQAGGQADAQVSGQIGTLEDITERRALQDRLTFQAWHDSLTRLPNRTFLEQVWPQLVQEAELTRTSLALLFIDLERFKQVNDSLGHQTGDQLLTLVARRLQSAVGNSGVVVRHGGDEFVVLLRDVKAAPQAQTQAQALLSALQIPLRVGHHLLRVSCRMGLSLYPQDATDLPTLLQHADAAMYRLKHARQAGVLAYVRGMSGGGLEQLDLESEFRAGLERGELCLHYQPQYELASGRQVGWEALVRWHHPRHGLLYPGAFLPMVADAGLFTPLGDWVMAETHRQLAEWAAQGRPLYRVAVNVDARQLEPGHLTGLMGRLQEARPLPPGLLEVEITEEALPSDIQAVAHDLKQLQARGVTVAIDDFGCGFSNLGQMQRLHFDRLKIDRSYVVHLESSASDRAIVQAAISIGHALGARVLAEGVETTGQLEVLQALGCDEGQGFLWARPRPADELEALHPND